MREKPDCWHREQIESALSGCPKCGCDDYTTHECEGCGYSHSGYLQSRTTELEQENASLRDEVEKLRKAITYVVDSEEIYENYTSHGAKFTTSQGFNVLCRALEGRE